MEKTYGEYLFMKPEVCILRSDGTNCDEELYYAFKKFGASPEFVHINELRNKSKKLKDFKILALPGGFSYGDDIASGKVLAIELTSFLKKELKQFIKNGGLILGICNGFQTLVRTGLLPFNNLGKIDVTLAPNDSGHFECRWVKIKVNKSKCAFLNSQSFTPGVKSSRRQENTPGVVSSFLDVAVNHGEGKFYADKKTLALLKKQNLIVYTYVNENGEDTQEYPNNPNGSLEAIAGITDSTGRIIGLMPHPEKFVDHTQHPNWRRKNYDKRDDGSFLFKNMIKFAKSK